MDLQVSTEAEQFNASLQILQTAPEILQANQTTSQKCITAGNFIISQIDQNPEGLTKELDDLAEKYLIQTADRQKEMNGSRAPITQLFTALAGKFTAAENAIDKAKPGTPANILQAKRNSRQAELAKKADELRKEEDRKANIIKEKGSYKGFLLLSLKSFIQDTLTAQKTKLNNYFEAATLEDLDDRIVKIKQPEFKLASVDGWNPSISTIYLTADDKAALKQETIDALFPQLAATWKEELTLHRIQLLDKTEGKRSQLMAMKNAADDKEEQRRLELQQQQQQAAAQKEIDEKAEQAKQKAANDAQMIAAQANSEAIFNKSVATATVADAPDKPTGYQIIVKNPAAYLLMAQLWFENVGHKYDSDQMDKTTYKQQKQWCADQKLKGGPVIENAWIEYMPVYTAKNKR